MDIGIMEKIVSNNKQIDRLTKKREALLKYRNNKGAYKASVQIVISAGPMFHDEWSDIVDLGMTEQMVEFALDAIQSNIDKLKNEINELEVKLMEDNK